MKNIVNEIDEFHDHLICSFIPALDEILKTTNYIPFDSPLDLKYRNDDDIMMDFRATAITQYNNTIKVVGTDPDDIINYIRFVHHLDNFYKLAKAISNYQENINWKFSPLFYIFKKKIPIEIFLSKNLK